MTGLLLSILNMIALRKFNSEYCLMQNPKVQNNTPNFVKECWVKIWTMFQEFRRILWISMTLSVVEIIFVVCLLFN